MSLGSEVLHGAEKPALACVSGLESFEAQEGRCRSGRSVAVLFGMGPHRGKCYTGSGYCRGLPQTIYSGRRLCLAMVRWY